MRKFFLALVALVGLSTTYAIGNYAMTQGSGTTFGSTVVGGVHYAMQFICDLTTPAQCATVSAAGAVKVDGSAVTQPVSGTVTANVGTGTRAVSIASGQVASGAYSSGSFSSGAFASGSYASGAFAAGSMVDLLTIIGSKAGGTAAASSSLAGCVYNTSAPTLTNGQQAGVQCDVNGNPKVSVVNTNANGQATMANSSPVVIASNQSAVPISIASAQVASGAFASGALASGSIAAGAMVDFLTTVGTKNAGTAATSSQLTGGVYNSTPLTLTNTQQSSLQFDASGYLKTRPSDGTKSAALDPCEANAQTYAPISITTATTTRIVTPSASNKTYICSLVLVTAAANNVGIVEGTGGTCGSGTAGVIGGTTAANGPNFSANGGLMLQAGGKVAAAQTAGTNVDLCLITSAATPLAGGIKYVQAP